MEAFKIASKLKRTPRFVRFDAYDDFRDPLKSHVLPTPDFWNWGLPKINRSQDVELVLSNYELKTSILVKFQWRSDIEDTNSTWITLKSCLTFITADQTYDFENIETYQPVESNVRPGYLLQFGSSGSSLRLINELPFRRLRLIFRGYVKDRKTNESRFLRLSIIGHPTSDLYDFKTRFDQDYFKKQWQSRPKDCKLKLDEAIDSLAFEDRIERFVRFVGEYQLEQQAKEVIYFWGSHSLVFERKPDVKRKHILCHLTNGQVIHLISSTSPDCGPDFSIQNVSSYVDTRTLHFPPLKNPDNLIWSELDSSSSKFEFTLETSRATLSVKCNRRQGPIALYDASYNGTEGWALFFEDSNQSMDLDKAMKDNLLNYKQRLTDGTAVANSKEFGSKKELVVTLGRDASSFDDGFVGAKASSLAHLIRFSEKSTYKTPSALAVTLNAYNLILSLNQELRAATEELEKFLVLEHNDETLRQKCNEICEKFKNSKCPQELVDELNSRLVELFPDTDIENHAFAVRSSSWGEDGEEMSAAGQLTTRLNVRGIQSIEQAIMECFASKYSVENVEYKRQHGLSPNLPMAVVIQSMVQCHKAGVMFTCDPISGNDRRIVITANFGLGESVVSGQADPDHIDLQVSLDGQLSVLEARAGSKSVVISEQPEVHQWNRSQCCMGVDEMMQIGSCGLAVSRYFGAPRDIEWGLLDGQLYLFQSRPITGLDLYTETELMHETDRCSRAEDEWRTRANLNEVFPYAVTPMTISYYVHGWNVMGARMIRYYSGKEHFVPDCCYDLPLDCCHTFFSLRRSFLFPCTGNENNLQAVLRKSFEMSFFGHEVDEQPGLINASRNLPPQDDKFDGFYFDMKTLPFKMAPFWSTARQYKSATNLENMILNESKQTTLKGFDRQMVLFKYLNRLIEEQATNLNYHFLATYIGSRSNLGLYILLSPHFSDPKQLCASVNKFLGIATNVISAQIPKRIANISKLIRSKGEQEFNRFSTMSIDDALKYITESSDQNLKREYDELIKRFGHRCYAEWEMRSTPWRADPKPIITMIQKSCESDNPTKKQEKLTNNRQILDSFGLKLSLKERYIIANIIAPRAQDMVAAREYTKDVQIKCIDIQRQILQLLAKELHSQLRIPDLDLIHFILFDELLPIMMEPQPSIVRQAIRRRQMFKKNFEGIEWRFEEIFGGYRSIPRHLKEKVELDSSLLNQPKLVGTPGSSGSTRGPVRIVHNYNDLNKINSGDILVTYSTDIAFSTVFPLVAGIITEVGGLVSHGAVVAREYGLPSLLGVVDATTILNDGEEILLDADNGYLIRISLDQSNQANN